jgi:hypothetical protein
VQQERGFVLHDDERAWDSTLRIAERISVTTSRDILVAMAKGKGPDHALVALGYAGWAPGQLEREIVGERLAQREVDARRSSSTRPLQTAGKRRRSSSGSTSRVSRVKPDMPERGALGPSRASRTVLAFDFGRRRIGVAVGEDGVGTAALFPRCAATRRVRTGAPSPR